MKEALEKIILEVRETAPGLKNRAAFEAFKATIQGPNGSLTAVMKSMGKVPKVDKPAMGKLINEAKTEINEALARALKTIEAAELTAKLGPAIDPTLPSLEEDQGTLHPIAQVREEMVALFSTHWVFGRRGNRGGDRALLLRCAQHSKGSPCA